MAAVRAQGLKPRVEQEEDQCLVWIRQKGAGHEEQLRLPALAVQGKWVRAIPRRPEEMETRRKTLGPLVHCCRGDDRPGCPILEDLGSLAAPVPTKPKRQATKALLKRAA